MLNVLAMSFEGELAPSFDLWCLSPQRKPPDGWGIGYSPGGDPAAEVLKEAAPPPGSTRGELVRAWEHLRVAVGRGHGDATPTSRASRSSFDWTPSSAEG